MENEPTTGMSLYPKAKGAQEQWALHYARTQCEQNDQIISLLKDVRLMLWIIGGFLVVGFVIAFGSM